MLYRDDFKGWNEALNDDRPHDLSFRNLLIFSVLFNVGPDDNLDYAPLVNGRLSLDSNNSIYILLLESSY